MDNLDDCTPEKLGNRFQSNYEQDPDKQNQNHFEPSQKQLIKMRTSNTGGSMRNTMNAAPVVRLVKHH